MTYEMLQEAYKGVENYPGLLRNLIALGISSYTIEVATGTGLYRAAEGENVLHQGMSVPRTVASKFDESMTIKAIRDNQLGKTDYAQFLDDIASAGVRFYEATLNGERKRVTYIGIGGNYQEEIAI